MADDLAARIEPLVRDPLLAEEMRGFYARVDAEIADHHPVCLNRGDCCKFAEYGHLLFVTPVELAYFIGGEAAQETSSQAALDPAPPACAAAPRAAATPLPVLRPIQTQACPYQIENVCTARSRRPLGCRVFFCDPASQRWQSAVYERYLAELKRIGRAHGVAYEYVEWLAALRACGS